MAEIDSFGWPNATSALVRNLGLLRQPVDGLLDQLRFWIDRNPVRRYQPVPGLTTGAARATGTQSRWRAMLPVITQADVQDAIDVGCDAGWFCLQLAAEDIHAIGVEHDPPAYRTAILAAKRSGLENVGVLVMKVEPESVGSLPAADCSLFLAVWHHIVREHGLEAGTHVLKSLWTNTRRLLFFETGESEMDASFKLPEMRPNPRDWIAGYLAENCAGATIRHLGTHEAFTPNHRACRRNLFVAIRNDGTDSDVAT